MKRNDYLIIGVVAVCLIALIFLIYEFSRLSKSRESQEPPLFEQEGDYPDYQEDYDSVYEYDPVTDTSFMDKPVTEREPAVVPAPAPATPAPAPAPETDRPSTASVSGNYLVLGGSFRMEANAQSRLKQVRKMGYSDAQITPFNYGAYATVLVGRYDTYSEAKVVADALNKKGIEAEVLKKRPSKYR